MRQSSSRFQSQGETGRGRAGGAGHEETLSRAGLLGDQAAEGDAGVPRRQESRGNYPDPGSNPFLSFCIQEVRGDGPQPSVGDDDRGGRHRREDAGDDGCSEQPG